MPVKSKSLIKNLVKEQQRVQSRMETLAKIIPPRKRGRKGKTMVGTYCNHWEAPTLSSHMKCRYRVISQETPAYKGKPICVNPIRQAWSVVKNQSTVSESPQTFPKSFLGTPVSTVESPTITTILVLVGLNKRD